MFYRIGLVFLSVLLPSCSCQSTDKPLDPKISAWMATQRWIESNTGGEVRYDYEWPWDGVTSPRHLGAGDYRIEGSVLLKDKMGIRNRIIQYSVVLEQQGLTSEGDDYGWKANLKESQVNEIQP